MWDMLKRLPGDTQNSLLNYPFFTFFIIIKWFLIKLCSFSVWLLKKYDLLETPAPQACKETSLDYKLLYSYFNLQIIQIVAFQHQHFWASIKCFPRVLKRFG